MKLSFVIPCYNAAAWLPAAVDSCLNQTHKDIEVVIVDDGSTDSTRKYLTWLDTKHDQRVHIVYTPNYGRSAARNTGNSYASGEVIMVLDADDMAYPKRAEHTLKAIEAGADVVYGSAATVNAIGTKTGEIIAEPWNRERALESMENRIVHSSMAYRRELADRYKYRDGDISVLGIDDWAFQLDLAMGGAKFQHVPNALCVYRILSTGVSRTRDEAKVKEAKERFIESLKASV